MITRRAFSAGTISLTAAGVTSAGGAHAQVVAGPARLLVGFPPGGAADTIARLLADQLKDYSSKLVVDNRAGAGGRVALEQVKASPPDGTTLIMTPASMMVLYPHVDKKLAYDPFKDFTPVSTSVRAPMRSRSARRFQLP